MPTPAELRAQSNIYVQAAAAATAPEIKKRLAGYAFALAQLAEQIERKRIDETVAQADLEYHRLMLSQGLDDIHRKLLEAAQDKIQPSTKPPA